MFNFELFLNSTEMHFILYIDLVFCDTLYFFDTVFFL